MRVATKEIRWHQLRPIFSCDLQPVPYERKEKQMHPYANDGQPYVEPIMFRLATAGGDNHIRIWLVTPLPDKSTEASTSKLPEGAVPSSKVEYLATMARHTGVVNAVRFSPTGHTLASAGDDGCILLWSLADGQVPATSVDETGEAQYAQEVWKLKRAIRGNATEIYDIAWSPDCNWLISGSTDNVARVYNALDGTCVTQISDHNNYVQGVCWDPRNEFIATQSSDRHMHVYGLDIRKFANNVRDFGYTLIGKNSKMDVTHKRLPSWTNTESETETETPDASTSSSIPFQPPADEEFRRPQPKRSMSRASDSSEASAFRQEAAAAFSAAHKNVSALDTEDAPMDPPMRAASPAGRKSSFSSSHASPPIVQSRVARSPSPMPPLPAIRVANASTSSSNLNAQTTAPVASTSLAEEARKFTTHLYGDQEVSPFFRRLAWSPDGSLLLTPAGMFEDPFAVQIHTEATEDVRVKKKLPKSKYAGGPKPTVYVYSRSNLNKPPVAHLPGHKSASIAIRFNPLLFELRPAAISSSSSTVNGSKTTRLDIEAGKDVAIPLESPSISSKPMRGAFDLPHRMIYAVATHESVYVYDTQQAGPVCIFGNLHYAPFTDLTWSADGQTLVLANQDGYCSVVAFEKGELGTPLALQPTAMTTPVSLAPPTSSPAAQQHTISSSPAASPLAPSPVDAAKPAQVASSAANRTDEGEPKPKKRRIALTTTAPADDGPESIL